MKKYFKIIVSAILIFTLKVSGQQIPVMSQYMFNGLVINPAYAGSKDYMSATLMVRKQWTGFEGAPSTQNASIHGPLSKKRVGLGLMISNDRVGITNQTDFFASYAYHIPVGNYKSKISLGLQGGITYLKSNFGELNVWDPDDPVYQSNTLTNLQPNFGFGAYYYSDRAYAGLSIPQLMSYDSIQTFNFYKDEIHHLSRHYYLNGGIILVGSRDFIVRPSFLVKYAQNAPLQYDLNLNILLNNIFWVGASYRSNDAVVAIIEYQVDRKLRIGYSYDYTLSQLSNYSSGSHEIMLGYDFGYNILKMKTPRYF
jgi:type IX secretion system PorP/SprF family membrane protein